MQRTWVVMLLAVSPSAGCAGDDGRAVPSVVVDGGDASSDAHLDQDAAVLDAPARRYGVPLCDELGVDNVHPYAVVIADEFTARVIDDCDVMQLLVTLTPDQANVWFERTTAWTSAFFGCPGTEGSVTSFGPVETGTNPPLTQTDIDTLVEYFAQGTEATLTLSSEQSAAVRQQLAEVAAPAVNTPIDGHALSLCTDAAGGSDGGVPDAGADVAADAPIDASDAGVDS